MCFANLIKNGGNSNGTFIPISFLSPNRGIFVVTHKLFRYAQPPGLYCRKSIVQKNGSG
jgi:hypothetical protein